MSLTLFELRTVLRFRFYKRKIGLLLKNDPRWKSKKWPEDFVYMSSPFLVMFYYNWWCFPEDAQNSPTLGFGRSPIWVSFSEIEGSSNWRGDLDKDYVSTTAWGNIAKRRFVDSFFDERKKHLLIFVRHFWCPGKKLPLDEEWLFSEVRGESVSENAQFEIPHVKSL